MKRKLLGTALAALAIVGLMASVASAQSTKTAVGMVAPSGTTISNLAAEIAGLESVIHIAQQKDIHVDISLECGLVTDTTVKSKGKNADSTSSDSATAEASVKVQVGVYDATGTIPVDVPIEPIDKITFCKRTQTLSAKLQGYIDNSDCFVDGVFDPTCDSLIAEEIRLEIGTLNANAFNWVIPNLDSGTYTIKASILIEDCPLGDPTLCPTAGGNGSESDSLAYVEHGMMVLDEIRLNNN